MKTLTNRLFLGILVAGMLQWPFLVLAHTASSVRIVTPDSGISVRPGDTISIVVDAIDTVRVVVLGTDPIGASTLQEGAGIVKLSMMIPADISPGLYYLTALGTTSDGSLVRSASISITVTGSEIATLTVSPNPMILKILGMQVALNIFAGDAHTQVAATASSNLAFISDNPSVASVTPNGMVTAQSAGTAHITTVYVTGANKKSVISLVRVLGSVRGDLNGDGKVTLEDASILESVLNTPANRPNDARDLNHDGKIDALDVKILNSLCTFPQCAIQP